MHVRILFFVVVVVGVSGSQQHFIHLGGGGGGGDQLEVEGRERREHDSLRPLPAAAPPMEVSQTDTRVH